MCDPDISNQLLENRIIFLCEEIDSDVSSKVVALLLFLNLEDREAEIKLYINSPGGDVSGFFAIYDTINYIDAPVRTICIGEAMSAAADLLAAGCRGKREATPNAQIMIHSIQLDEVSGSVQEVKSYIDRTRDLNNKMMRIFARNTNQSLSKIKRDCKSDKFLNAEEALEYGIIDRILEAKVK